MQDIMYPRNPDHVGSNATALSPGFRKEIVKVMGAILLFILVYILMIILAIGLFIACAAGGIALIYAAPRFITLMIGLGLVGLGVMVMVFLVKFIFARKKIDTSGDIEVDEQELPDLVAFIRKLSEDTNTIFPKKIFLSPDVNAAVFYNSSLWSMIFPVRKNLKIGLGLVNSVNLSEFKAVIAHEFGHFSQKSMKLGSYVYNVNKVIFNMLFDNTGWQQSLQGFANVSSYFAFFAQLTVHVVRGIQWVLQQMYRVVNKRYMALSREMEFHADAIAASVSGSNNCISALRRIELGDVCFNQVLEKCNTWIRKKEFTDNIYPMQRDAMGLTGKRLKVPMIGDLPVLENENSFREKISRVTIKNQWASHPTMQEREQRLGSLSVIAETSELSAWTLFGDAVVWQQKLTGKLYETAPANSKETKVSDDTFRKELEEEQEKYSLPEAYNHFYDNRNSEAFDVKKLASEVTLSSFVIQDFSELFSSQKSELPKKLMGSQVDIQWLKAISENQIQIKTFDFDGNKFSSDDASIILRKINGEKDEFEKQLKASDEKAFQFFYWCALKSGGGLAEDFIMRYDAYFQDRARSGAYADLLEAINTLMQPVFSGQKLAYKIIDEKITDLKSRLEPKFKEHLRKYLDEGVFDEPANADLRKSVQSYLGTKNKYFTGQHYLEDELKQLHQMLIEATAVIYSFRFMVFKQLLNYQLQLYQTLASREKASSTSSA